MWTVDSIMYSELNTVHFANELGIRNTHGSSYFRHENEIDNQQMVTMRWQ